MTDEELIAKIRDSLQSLNGLLGVAAKQDLTVSASDLQLQTIGESAHRLMLSLHTRIKTEIDVRL